MIFLNLARICKKFLGFVSLVLLVTMVVFLGCQKTSSSVESKSHEASEVRSDVTSNSENDTDSEEIKIQEPNAPNPEGSEKAEEVKEEESGPPPKAVFPETAFNVGEVEKGDEISHTYKIKNVGPGILRIISAKPG
ncbi:MAG: hypothetical protein A2161_09995 [Candidatus Schekmanbacteria bacterium RBG_13_48_7]|uniref:DUF1573 domain-containing protein n=1 Tax=Candidatus Schekmanbacteria bacterium RBG_13_48_7 TaxID=1817878 RepID=A0A1F7RZD1_9BACT|nr:MAG: hypothetical protein A2161_09995 [Candidatus Schekmanbacteria bacterium RBG_13_48_7]